MLHFKNSELTKLYNVSFTAVSNWIEAARKGKLALQLYDEGGKSYIANTVKNQALIEELVQARKKYVTNRDRKTIVPSSEFYRLFSRDQVLDIIANLTVHREIPLQYTYFDGGAEYWDRYAWRMLNETTPNTLRCTIELLTADLDNIARLLQGRRHVNIIDLGVGNALPVRGLLEHLLDRGMLRRYVAIDSSKEMLAIAERNIKEWFDDKVPFEGYVRDIGHQQFKDLVADDYLETEGLVNLVLLLGGTLSNFRAPGDVLRTINNSMMPDDLLFYSLKLDSPRARRYFDFDDKPGLAKQHKLIPDLLGIDESFYEAESTFDEADKARYIRIRLKVALSINFIFDKAHRVIELNKGDTILLWRARHVTALDVIHQFTSHGFSILQASQTHDHDYMMVVADMRMDGR